MRWAVYAAHIEESRNAYRVLVGIPEGERLSGRLRRRWEETLKWISRRWFVKLGTAWILLKIETYGGLM